MKYSLSLCPSTFLLNSSFLSWCWLILLDLSKIRSGEMWSENMEKYELSLSFTSKCCAFNSVDIRASPPTRQLHQMTLLFLSLTFIFLPWPPILFRKYWPCQNPFLFFFCISRDYKQATLLKPSRPSLALFSQRDLSSKDLWFIIERLFASPS